MAADGVRSWPDVVPADNRTLGWSVLEWASEFLRQPDGPDAGDPWVYTPEQVRIVLRWYEIDERGRFVHRRGVLRRMKGWGKDPFLASIAAVELCGPCRFDGFDANDDPVAVPHSAPLIQVAAVSRDQTRNTMTVFPGLLSQAALDEYAIEPGKEIIWAQRGRARIESVTSSPRSLEGPRPTLVIANETHHWLANNEGHAMADVIRRNLAKAREGAARVMEITNAHQPGEDSVAERTYEAWRDAADSGKPLAGVYYDSLEAPMVRNDEGETVPVPELTDDQVKEGLRASRGDSVWLDVEGILAEIRDPTTKESVGRRFYLNQVAAAEETWIDPAMLRACKGGTPLVAGETVTLGFDGSIRDDSTVLTACRLDDGHLQYLNAWERPDGPEGSHWQVPRTEVDTAVQAAFETYDVISMYADPPHWQDYIDAWAALYGEKTVLEFWTNQGLRMAKALERLNTALVTQAVTYDGSELLTRHFGNAVAVERRGGTQIVKRRHGDKIDGAVTATLAYEARNDCIADGALHNQGGWMVSI